MKLYRVDISENISWTLQKGSWTIHLIITAIFKLSFGLFMGEALSWQLAVIMYNLLTFYLFHWKVGDPFSSEFYNCTFWEQINEQEIDTPHIRFLALYPAILFIFVNKISQWNSVLFAFYVITLLMVIIPKLSFMHLRRIFGYRSLN